ncbi:unnamed protein product [Diatraea saccharalis]|uniref:Uncharacterized protein n=1 Tax=Diatraea saccharalis TaxID=40085 RepID=A0A9N9R6K1_9NEOP|nr:unnamed protein product [Diatraea saccharalis]
MSSVENDIRGSYNSIGIIISEEIASGRPRSGGIVTSSFASRVSTGTSRRTAATTGEFFVDLKVYKTGDYTSNPVDVRYKTALVTVKLQCEDSSPSWDALQTFLGQAWTNIEQENITTVSDEECAHFDPHQYLDSFQCAQDPLEGFTEDILKMQSSSKSLKRTRHNRKIKCKRRQSIQLDQTAKYCGPVSFVINSAPTKGLRLIRIQVIELDRLQRISDSVNDNSVLLNSQYVVKDVGDEIMDQTEKIINNISKKICGYSYTNCF